MTWNRRTVTRTTILLLGLGALVALSAAVPAQEPPLAAPGAKKASPVDLKKLKQDLLLLKSERSKLAAEREGTSPKVEPLPGDTGAGAEANKLKRRIADLLDQLSGAKPAVRPDPFEEPIVPIKRADKKDDPGAAVNPLALAQAHFLSENYKEALAAFRKIDLTAMKAEERVPVQYLIASCLRKLGKDDEATALYREVAGSRQDPVMVECAQWQLATMRWQRELRGQIDALEKRRKAIGGQP
jgi:tetratricopeptide (TPR) repeat protein